MGNWVHVVGTGTIGEPLIGLLTKRREELGIATVSFSKNRPTSEDVGKVEKMVRRGARLCVLPEIAANGGPLQSGPRAFEQAGYPKPTMLTPEAIAGADVIMDCTPEGRGIAHKAEWYAPRAARDPNFRGAIAQGSEFGFGKPYAYRINETALERGTDRFIHVVSCNTHNIAVLLRALGGTQLERLAEASFTCIRRASDVSQRGGFIAGIEAGTHEDAHFGTHHARDAYALLSTLFASEEHRDAVLGAPTTPRILSSACKAGTQYMHVIHADLLLRGRWSHDEIVDRLDGIPTIALTEFFDTPRVFAVGRDYGFRGRLFNQTVVNPKTVAVFPSHDPVFGHRTRIHLWSFTPQDGNSLLSSVAAVAWLLDPETFEQRIECVKKYLMRRI
ncbi:hypothetical protein HY480_03350 [Candidatus Uhrbacteria bacterium]|nr:hypothetical protein [Candidatus Uhrbacteria bacterium]